MFDYSIALLHIKQTYVALCFGDLQQLSQPRVSLAPLFPAIAPDRIKGGVSAVTCAFCCRVRRVTQRAIGVFVATDAGTARANVALQMVEIRALWVKRCGTAQNSGGNAPANCAINGFIFHMHPAKHRGRFLLPGPLRV